MTPPPADSPTEEHPTNPVDDGVNWSFSQAVAALTELAALDRPSLEREDSDEVSKTCGKQTPISGSAGRKYARRCSAI